jgi:hypothetical protein
LCSCTNSNDYFQSKPILVSQVKVSDKNESPLDEEICIISESPCLLGELTSFCFLNDDRFIISTRKPAQLIIFDRNGKQIVCLKQAGKGPMEFLSPSLIKAYHDKIYVWCEQQLKLIVFDGFGNPIREYVGFKIAIKDFEIWNNKAYLYMAGGISKNLIKVFDLEKEEFIAKFGEVSEESILLSLFSGAGGLFLTESKLHYSAPDQLGVFFWDENNYLYEFVEFVDKEFQVSNTNNAIEMINADRNRAIEYISTNSVIKGIYDLYNRIVIIAEVGKFDMKMRNIASSRYTKYYIYNKSEKSVFAFKEQIDFSITNASYTSFNGSLYFIEIKPETEKDIYRLKKRTF